jgi:dipeptidyl aminopeptidase/acylaminoacyl peptidase
MIDDIVDATRWSIEQGYADASRICIMGASYGGYAALMAVVRAPDLYQCAIGYVGVYDLERLYTDSDIPEIWSGVGYLEKVLGRDKQELREFSPVNHADKIKADVMLIHGKQDTRAPVKHARLMRKKLKKAGKDVTWLLYGKGGHGIWDIENRRELYSGILEFLKESLGRTNSPLLSVQKVSS